MKERPILFSGSMVRAIRAGTKWQTRRSCKPIMVEAIKEIFGNSPGPFLMTNPEAARLTDPPYGVPGDQLWVRETWRASDAVDNLKPTQFHNFPVRYDADGEVINHGGVPCRVDGKTRVSIHMPRWASRIQLEVTGVRIERLNDISEADARAEGIVRNEATRGWGVADGPAFLPTARAAYRDLWEQINGLGSWVENPLVWVVEFNVLKGRL